MTDDELKALAGQLRSLVTCGCNDDEDGQIGAKAATALETLARENVELKGAFDRVNNAVNECHGEIDNLTRERDEARAEVERLRNMRTLLPPAAISDQTYLEGWCEGQAYLILNHGTEEQFNKAVDDTELLTQLSATQARLEEAVGIIRKIPEWTGRHGGSSDALRAHHTFFAKQASQ